MKVSTPHNSSQARVSAHGQASAVQKTATPSPETSASAPVGGAALIEVPYALPHTPTRAAAVREVEKHANELGVPLVGDVAKGIQQAELALGRKHDARVSDADMARAVRWSEQATVLEPARQNDLFGFTRVVDAKVHLTSATLDALAQALPDAAALWRAVDTGPGGGELVWKKPANATELVASLVRQMMLGAGASRQIVLDPSLANWVNDTLTGAGAELKLAMGGAGAFAANLGAAVGVDVSFFSKDPLPQAIVERFSPVVKAMTPDGKAVKATQHQDASPARTNMAAEYAGGQAFTLLGKSTAVVNGVEKPIVPDGTGRVILGTQAKDVKPGFAGVSDDALRRMAKSTDLFFFVGAHYLTQGAADEAKTAAAALARSLDVMKKANPSLLRHAQYVVPKTPENEPVVLQALKGSIDSLALNSVEAAPLMDALHDAGMSTYDVDPLLPREAAEDPAQMIDAALAMKDALDLQRVHFHGLEGDLVISGPGTPGADDPDRQRAALLKARQLASNKAANESGEIKNPDDVWPVVPSVRGSGLAALHRFADALQAQFHLDDATRTKIVERWWFQDPATKTVIHFVPSRGIHDRAGGTVSLGDTIDSTALIYAMKPERPPVLKHGSSFA